jgi:sugar phosphate isomerase/epimerase
MLEPALDFLTALELTPPQLVDSAAGNGCRFVNQLVQGYAGFPFPESNLVHDMDARRTLRDRCRDRNVQIDVLEVFVLDEHCDPETFRPALEAGAYLGATAANTLALDATENRLMDRYGRFCEISREYRLEVLVEVIRVTSLTSITAAVAFFEKSRLDVKIELDSLHFFRYGGNVEEIVKYRDRIGRAQICDGPPSANDAEYPMEALYRRGIPGEGQLPLADFLAALPDGIVVGVEVPRPDFRTTERISRAVQGFRNVQLQAEHRRRARSN